MNKLYGFVKYQCFNVDKIGKDSIKGRLTFSESKAPAINNRVSLIEKYTFKVLDSVFTNKNGDYIFNNLDLKSNAFFIVSHDKTKQFNAVIADNIGGKNVDS